MAVFSCQNIKMTNSYICRHLATHLPVFLAQFPAVVILGARQVGKSTFLAQHLDEWRRLDLEDGATEEWVGSDPRLFLRDHPDHVCFDEAQRIPSLFPALRVAIDRDRRPGRYVLTGSASPHLVKGVSESLAGRAAVLELRLLTTAEVMGRAPSPFLDLLLAADSAPRLREGLDALLSPAPDAAIESRWMRGGYPEPYLLDDSHARARWFDAYIRLLAERDLADLHRDLRPVAVLRLLRMLAVRHGQVLNVSDLARDAGVSTKTIKAFLDILEGAFLWFRLSPYHVNVGKRLVRQPKGYLCDTGILHALLAVGAYDDLQISPFLGASWESFVIGELLTARSRLDHPPEPFFWSTHQGAEVDLVLERGGRVWPIEVKHTSHLQGRQHWGLRSFLDDVGDRAPFGVLIYRGEHVARVTERIVAVPASLAVGIPRSFEDLDPIEGHSARPSGQ